VIVNLSAEDRPAMSVGGIFGDDLAPGAKLRSAAYNVAEGQLLNVAAKAKRTQGTVGGSGNIAVPAFSIVSISAAE